MSKRQHTINNATEKPSSKKQKIDLHYKECRNQIADILLEEDRKGQQKLQHHIGKDFSTLTELEKLIQEYTSCNYSIEVANSEGEALFAIAFFASDMEVADILIEHGAITYISQEKYTLDEAEINIGSPTLINEQQHSEQQLTAVSQDSSDDNIIIVTTTDNILLNVIEDEHIIEETLTESELIQKEISEVFDNRTLRQLTTKYGPEAIIHFYADNKIDLEHKDNDGDALLHILAEEGKDQLIRELIPTLNITIPNQSHYTPLHLAIANTHHEAVKALIEAGANINYKNTFGQTPLHTAAILGDLKMAACLLRYNEPDLSIRDHSGYTPINCAIEVKNNEVAELLIQHATHLQTPLPNTTTELHVAVKIGNTKLTRLLVEKKADINAQDHKGKTPLRLAQKLLSRDELLSRDKEHYSKIIKFLVENGGNLGIGDQQNSTCQEMISAYPQSNYSATNANPAKEILTILPQSTSAEYLTPPVRLMPEIPTSIPVSVIVKSAPTKGIPQNSPQFTSTTTHANYNNYAGQPEVEFVCSVPRPLIRKNIRLLAPEDKVQAVFEILEQKWRDAGEKHILELSSFDGVSPSPLRQFTYIDSFLDKKMFKLLQAIANLPSDSQKFNTNLAALSAISSGQSVSSNFRAIGKALFGKDEQGNYKIKEESEFLLECISLPNIANICWSNVAKEKIKVINITIDYSNKIFSLLRTAKSEPSTSIESTKAIDELLNQWNTALKDLIPSMELKFLINKVKTKCIEIINTENLSNADDNNSTTIMTHNAKISIRDEEKNNINEDNFTPLPNNTAIINYDFPTPVEGASSITLLGSITP